MAVFVTNVRGLGMELNGIYYGYAYQCITGLKAQPWLGMTSFNQVALVPGDGL